MNSLNRAAELLREYYGPAAGFGPPYRWTTLVQVVAAPTRGRGGKEVWPENGPLHSARETADSNADGLSEILQRGGRPGRLAGPLRSLARWWLKDAAREEEAPSAWERATDALREELRSLPGVSLALADRVLLFVGARAAFPIDRGTLRIVCRHGWMDAAAEYDEWQAFFRRAAADGVSLSDLSQGFHRIGGRFCGPRCECDGCPLRELLPITGPVPISDEGEGNPV